MIPEFSLRLICGLSLWWGLAPRAAITSGYFRIQLLLTLGLSVLLLLSAGQLPMATPPLRSWTVFFLSLSLAALSFLGSLFWTLERRRGGTAIGFLTLVVSSTLLALLQLWKGDGGAGETWRGLADAFTSAWLIGVVTGTMLLGHWHLTATGMSLAPLTFGNRLIVAAALLRLGVTSWLLAVQGAGGGPGMLTLRAAGLAGPLILAGMTERILRYRNTQSATGVLYAATVLVFMGEMARALS